IAPDFQKETRQPELLEAMEKNPGLVGIGIDAGAALVVRGRALGVLGEGQATFCLAASAARPQKTIALKASPGRPGVPSRVPYGAVLTSLRRSARARTEAPFPPKKAPVAEVARGSLVIVGGGGMPADITKKFIELAGGPDALIVVLPTALGDVIPEGAGEAMF